MVTGERQLQIGNVMLGKGLVLAPMAGMTDVSFRLIARELGADLVFSEMVSAEGLVRRNPATWRLLYWDRREKPLAIQIFGSEAEVMAEAAGIVVDHGADIVDLNMGCPVRKILRQGAGAILMNDVQKVARVVEAVQRSVAVPVTVKIRAGWSRQRINAVEVAQAAAAAGAAAITVHPRTAQQGFAGKANWQIIRQVKEDVDVPVIGNGDVRQAEQVEQMKSATRCDGVMIGRAAVGNPWIFQQAKGMAAGESCPLPSAPERFSVMMRHLRLYLESQPEGVTVACLRRRVMWYTRGLPGSSKLRHVVSRCRHTNEVLKLAKAFFDELGQRRCPDERRHGARDQQQMGELQ
ncbi:MAG: tRNA dihydrouridine synthase DusB [Deltaproteobacteria bacterium]|nr:tRNA dihydrouridine synthase DusB [Deltaproteobacteria bacterium]